jgi:hypothetical protein
MDLQTAVKMSPFRFIFKVSLIHVDGGATVLQQDPISKTQDSARTLLFYTALPYLKKRCQEPWGGAWRVGLCRLTPNLLCHSL